MVRREGEPDIYFTLSQKRQRLANVFNAQCPIAVESGVPYQHQIFGIYCWQMLVCHQVLGHTIWIVSSEDEHGESPGCKVTVSALECID